MLTLRHYEAVRDGHTKPPAWHRAFRCNVPEGKRGPWSVERFRVELDLQNMRMMRDGRGCFPGEYTRLRHEKRGIVMSDTTAEISDHAEPFRRARGRVLIHGLGLGCFAKAALSKPDVTAVDVVEIDADVIALVAPHLAAPRLTVHHADAFDKKWPRGCVWDIAWHDIWDNITTDNIPSMDRLQRRFRDKCGWQGCWGRSEARRLEYGP